MPLAGCYSTLPVETTPAPGATVVLDLNDRARVALGDRIGPSALKLEGVVQTATDSDYVLRVSSVEYLNGQTNRWSGEQLNIPASLVSRAWHHEFSRSRTTALSVGLAAALLTAILKTSFLHIGSGTIGAGDPRPGGGSS
jgi:hypothetical protein